MLSSGNPSALSRWAWGVMPNQALHLTGAAILVSRDTTLLQ